jgi:hypothetical protein
MSSSRKIPYKSQYKSQYKSPLPSKSPSTSKSQSKKRSFSTLSKDPKNDDSSPSKRLKTNKEIVQDAWEKVSKFKSRTDNIDEEKLKEILKEMETDAIKSACETDKLLQFKCNAIHNKIRDLLGAWETMEKRGGKRTRRSKRSNKRKSHKKH